LLPGVFQWKIIESHFNAPEHEQLREYFRTMLFQTDPSVLKQARRALNRFDCRDELDQIDAPTLMLVGEENGKWFVELARETAAGIDEATFEILSDGSDPSNLTVTSAFDDAVLTFLKNTETASG
jgi:pimeloyl-ACP methyl ester carboxylesterase